MVAPYLGLGFTVLGGDVGDLYDREYGAELGLKVYPFEHAGFLVGVRYANLKAAVEGLPDAFGLSLGVGLLMKF